MVTDMIAKGELDLAEAVANQPIGRLGEATRSPPPSCGCAAPARASSSASRCPSTAATPPASSCTPNHPKHWLLILARSRSRAGRNVTRDEVASSFMSRVIQGGRCRPRAQERARCHNLHSHAVAAVHRSCCFTHSVRRDTHFDPIIPALATHFDVIAIDLPGFGDSKPLPASVEPNPAALAGAVAEQLDQLGVRSAHLVGNSLGGWVALELAARCAPASVTLLAPAGLWRGHTPLYDRASLQATRWLSRHALRFLCRLVDFRLGRAVVLGQTHGRPYAHDPAASAIRDPRDGYLPRLRCDTESQLEPSTPGLGARRRSSDGRLRLARPGAPEIPVPPRRSAATRH